MTALAAVDLMAAQLGLSHLGGALALYDLPHEEQVEALAVAMVRNQAPDLADGGMSFAGASQLWVATRPQPPKKPGIESMLPPGGG